MLCNGNILRHPNKHAIGLQLRERNKKFNFLISQPKFVRTEMNLIVFSGPSNCVNTQYAALSGLCLYGPISIWVSN